MGKFSLLTTLTLDAAGFNKGIDQAKVKTKNFGDGVNKMGDGLKGAFKNFGGLVSPLTKDMGGLSSMVTGVIGGFKQMIPALSGIKVAIMATGIGAIILAITAALTGLYTWLKRSDEGADSMRKGLNVLKAVMEVILDRVALMGGAIVKLFKGDFSGAAKDVRSAFSGIKDDIQKNIEKADELSKLQREAEIFNMDFATKRAKLEVDISELQLKARDKEKFNEVERLKFVKELENANKKMYDLDVKQTQYLIDEETMKQNLGYSNREDKRKLNELEAQLIQKQAEYNGNLKETLKLNNSLFEEVNKIKNFKIDPLSIDLKIKDIDLDVSDTKDALDDIFGELQADIDAGKYKVKLINYFDAFGEFKDVMNSIDFQSQLITNSINGISDAFVNLAETGELSFSKMVGNMINSIRSVLNALLAEAIIGLFTKETTTKGFAGLALAAAGVSVLMGVWNKYAKFESGGIVGGNSFSGDNIPIRVNSGEMILNKNQQGNLFKMINGGNGGGGNVTFRIEGDALVGVLNNYNRKINSYN